MIGLKVADSRNLEVAIAVLPVRVLISFSLGLLVSGLTMAARAAEDQTQEQPQAKKQVVAQDQTQTQSQAQIQAQAWSQYIEQRIKARWKVAQQEGFAGKSARVAFRIGPGGNVSHLQIKESSGDGAFDSVCLDAVKEAGALPLTEAIADASPTDSSTAGMAAVSVILDFKAFSDAEKESLRAHLERQLAEESNLDSAAAKNPDIGKLLNKAVLEEKLGNFSEAIADFQAAADRSESNLSSQFALKQWTAAVYGVAECRSRSGDWQGARRTLAAGIERARLKNIVDGKIIDLLELFARVLYKENMPAQAAQIEARLQEAKHPGERF